ncbi:MAG TPA: hypothetical protein VMU15_05585 [Anaeromyxobacter sp.]|nr:hypothetical protein [Anaeromyxobacter sp.]
MNEVLARGPAVSARHILEEEYLRRPELVRDARGPSAGGGRKRANRGERQARGGTHVRSTAEVGRARIVRFDNQGKDNKRVSCGLGGSEG